MRKKDIPEYRIWKAMKARCYAPCNRNSTYQKNGISVCKEWVNNFDAFYRDMGPRPTEFHTIDRIDNSAGYSKENCRWATRSIQAKNRGDFNIIVEFNGEKKTLKEWSVCFGIKYTTLIQRINRSGLSFEDAIQKDPFNRLVEINGLAMTVTEWCEKLDRRSQTVYDRIHKGKNPVVAIMTPTANGFGT